MNTKHSEVVPDLRCSNNKKMTRKARVVTGTTPYSYGIVTKQPNSNWHERLLSIRRRMEDESGKFDEEAKKNNQRDIINSKFHMRTDKRNFETTIRNRVNQRLKAAEEELECKRERLRELLLAEEKFYLREMVTQAQRMNESIFEEKRIKALQIRVKKEAEDAALAAEKRLQQYMNRCEELRTFREALNTKEVTKAVSKQIEDKQKQREADKEIEKMWHDVAQKNYALMVAYEEEEERKRKNKIKEISTILQNQIKGRTLLKEKEEQLKMEERSMLEKERQKLQEEEEIAKREKEYKKQKLYEEMEEVRRQSAELHARRQAQEKVLNDMFCQLIQEELKKEQSLIQDNKSQLRKESDLFRNYLKETAIQRTKAEAEADELRAKEFAKLEAVKHEEEIKKCEAILKLKHQVMKEREEQIKAKKRQKEEEERTNQEEARLAELLRLESLEIEKEQKRASDQKQKEYNMVLSKQIEYNRQLLLKQCEEEETQLKESIMKEEAYFNKVKDIIANKCSAQIHPFMKKFQGMAI